LYRYIEGEITLRRRAEVVAKVHPDCVCPISHALMRDPVVAADGRSYERREIEAWFARGQRKSPLTDDNVTTTTLFPNVNLRLEIERALEAAEEAAAGAEAGAEAAAEAGAEAAAEEGDHRPGLAEVGAAATAHLDVSSITEFILFFLKLSCYLYGHETKTDWDFFQKTPHALLYDCKKQ
jgi:hypothetical protein